MFVKKLKSFLERIKDKNPEKTKINFNKLYKIEGDPWGTKEWDRRLSIAFSLIEKINFNNKKILDIGCSYGQFLNMVIQKNPKTIAYGIDIAEKPIKILLKEKIIKVKLASITDIPFPDSFFDDIFCLEVLYYVKNKNKAISEVRRVLKKGGLFLLGVTYGKGYFTEEDELFFLMGSNFILVKREIILPKPLPKKFPLIESFLLFLAKFLPHFFNLKGYYLFQKI